ncbi:cysteine desulfurase, catalytic subunit CsdA [Lactobacillus selangorensis]|uniref:cysteine desulfurase n=1 Tax=Lactobacillus selangorensis TaxID=81857 RepID=A0A0R2FSL7_9LACO|nr:SufS family cysteine desulfurase [Lactobacillus selangorensis]KRN27652.1 cysteine desulfurase, catalytic subunit CsdA [Lactobacillus selangorensis]KRN30381.1 cysteine desulfurase, catalytic subunit CsdA [Lactobacillus selangorensis]
MKRNDFPILTETMNDEPFIYFDSAATSLTPEPVVNAIRDYYRNVNTNVHRGVYTLAAQATEHYEAVRQQTADFIHADKANEIIFTSGTTAGLNQVARGWGDLNVHAGDEIVVTLMEHHSNLVPWQQLAQRQHAVLKVIGITADGQLDWSAFQAALSHQTKVVAVTAVSNVLGTRNPITKIAAAAHAVNAAVVVDAAQAVAHFPIDVQAWNADFIAFSAHKMFGPTGVGVLYGKTERLQEMAPTQFGGEMIEDVTQQTATFKAAPLGFEAGTPNIAGVYGLGAAIDYLAQIGYEAIQTQEHKLDQALKAALDQPDVTVYGSNNPFAHTGVFSFNLTGIHPHDVATALDQQGVAVRAGHHCAEPLTEALGVHATVRASVGFYNTIDECARFGHAIQATRRFFA